METVGQRLRVLRKTMDKDQKEISQVAGVSAEYISRIENDKENPTVGMLERIAEALNYDMVIDFIPHGIAAEQVAEYRATPKYTPEEQHYMDIFIKLMRSKREGFKSSMKGILDQFEEWDLMADTAHKGSAK